MILRTTHKTVYRYRSPSVDSHNEVRLRPLTDEFQRCLQFKLTTEPWAQISSFTEPGGEVHTFSVSAPHESLTIVSEAEVETLVSDPFVDLDLLSAGWSHFAEDATKQRYAEFLAPSVYTQPIPSVIKLARKIQSEQHASVIDFLMALNRYLRATLKYLPGVTGVHSKLDEVMELQAGVCQDFAHLMIACCRVVGIPARYVSGYLCCEGSAKAMRGDHATHAWLECPMPDGRWLGLDPTNNLLANDRYVRIHVGRDYSDVTPTRGVYIGLPSSDLEVSVQVDRVRSDART